MRRAGRTSLLALLLAGVTADLVAAPSARPVLDLLPPIVDQSTLRIAFRARNRGEADLPPSPMTVAYRVLGVARGPAQLVAEGSFLANRIAIPHASAAELGAILLPDRRRAFAFEHLTIDVKVEASAVEAVNASFPHRWTTRTRVVEDAELRALFPGTILGVHVNNFDPSSPSGRARDDCRVTLRLRGREADQRFDLEPARIELPSAGERRTFTALIDRLASERRGDASQVSVRDGKLALRVQLTGPPGDLKLGALNGDVFDDRAVSDLDLQPFAVEVLFALALAADHSGVVAGTATVQVPAAGPAAVRPPELAPLIAAALRGAREEISRRLKALTERPEIREAVAEAFASALRSEGTVTVLHRVEGRGSAIVITYL